MLVNQRTSRKRWTCKAERVKSACVAAADDRCEVTKCLARQAAVHPLLSRRRLAACSTACLECRRRAWWLRAARPAGGTGRARSGTPGTHQLRGTQQRRLQQAGRSAAGAPLQAPCLASSAERSPCTYTCLFGTMQLQACCVSRGASVAVRVCGLPHPLQPLTCAPLRRGLPCALQVCKGAAGSCSRLSQHAVLLLGDWVISSCADSGALHFPCHPACLVLVFAAASVPASVKQWYSYSNGEFKVQRFTLLITTTAIGHKGLWHLCAELSDDGSAACSYSQHCGG